ncbi:MAG: DUF433 domain-containing protein [Verrucomicrobia bacterium]|nr:DUF433 domain-containing protein [Verrucomicrobiota bacterium]
MKPNRKVKRIELGRFIVADPKICHGKPTFKGTRIMVWQLFEHLALGEPLEDFPKHFPGRVSLEAAREALELGRKFFAENPQSVQGWATACGKA